MEKNWGYIAAGGIILFLIWHNSQTTVVSNAPIPGSATDWGAGIANVANSLYGISL